MNTDPKAPDNRPPLKTHVGGVCEPLSVAAKRVIEQETKASALTIEKLMAVKDLMDSNDLPDGKRSMWHPELGFIEGEVKYNRGTWRPSKGVPVK